MVSRCWSWTVLFGTVKTITNTNRHTHTHSEEPFLRSPTANCQWIYVRSNSNSFQLLITPPSATTMRCLNLCCVCVFVCRSQYLRRFCGNGVMLLAQFSSRVFSSNELTFWYSNFKFNRSVFASQQQFASIYTRVCVCILQSQIWFSVNCCLRMAYNGIGKHPFIHPPTLIGPSRTHQTNIGVN